MKVTLERNALLKSLGHVHRVVERRNTYPILANVLLKAADGKIDLRATDLDIEVTESVPAMVATAGTTTVPAHTLYEIVRKLADGAEVRLETEGGEQMLHHLRPLALPPGCLSPDSFPDLKSGTFTHSFSLPAATLRELIERTQFAISNEETRYYLNGIYVHTLEVGKQTVLRAVATDGHRMARAETEAPDGARGMPGIIIPKKTVGEVVKLLEGAEGEVGVEVSDTKIRFTLDGLVLLSKLIEGTFPDYDRVTPKNNDKTLSVDRASLRHRRRPRLDHRVRARRQGRQTRHRRRQSRAFGHQPGPRHRQRRSPGRLRARKLRDRLQRPLPARHHRPDQIRQRGLRVQGLRLSHAGPRRRRRQSALRADADAGVTRGAAGPRRYLLRLLALDIWSIEASCLWSRETMGLRRLPASVGGEHSVG